ncbi:GTP pyrophosphokinase [Cytobacillus praedii]|uniref:GTP pyrophosphokinase n=1 Tax=Cytobacillus praedii TaxID=1742358 RepID=UPI002E232F10|nr:GTP pyrophosphokinase [Cytobacillus praedii]
MKLDALERAIQIAVEAHYGQKDKGNSPYILHPLRVMHNVKEYNEKIIAVLHDVIEDTNVTLDDIRNEGYPEEILFALDCITKRKGEVYKDYLERVKQSELSRIMKLADLEDNCDLSRINFPVQKDFDRVQKYKASLAALKFS